MRRGERLASTGTLAAGLAHQLNNPLGAILNASEFGLLSLDEGDLDAVRKALRDDVQQARRCGLLVHELLRFARQEPLEKRREELVGLVHRAVDLSDSYALTAGCQIRIDVEEAALPVEMAAVEMEQVIVNLLRNSIEARSQRIRVLVSKSKNRARVEVRDDGRGIDPEDIGRVFDPFFSTRDDEGGTGLGLSVAHGIVEQHGGRSGVERLDGRGTLVWFELPLASS